LHNEIKTGGAKKEELDATISKCKADIESCSVKIEDLSGAIAADEKELAQATAVRAKEQKTFAASEAELVDAIDTLDRQSASCRRRWPRALHPWRRWTRITSKVCLKA